MDVRCRYGGCGRVRGRRWAGNTNAAGIPETLRVSLIPNIAPDKQAVKYEPLRAYLEKALNTKVELFVANDYAGVVTALAAKKVDVAYLGGLTYVPMPFG